MCAHFESPLEKTVKTNCMSNAGRGGSLSLDHLKAKDIVCDQLSTQQVILEGIALNGLIVQKLVSSMSSGGSGGADYSYLLGLIQQLQSQVSTAQQQIASLTVTVNRLDAYEHMLSVIEASVTLHPN